MSPGMKFRRTCNSCNATFFTEDRRGFYCAKCVRKKAAAPPPPPPKPERPAFVRRDSSLATNVSAKPQTGADGQPLLKTFKQRKPPKFKPKTPRIPKAKELTPELEAKITAAYEELKESGEPLKKIHAEISNKVWAKLQIVAEVVGNLRPRKRKSNEQCSLSDEQRQQVLDCYLELVAKNERPEEGRRSYIAKKLQLPEKEVILAVREWSFGTMGQLSRQQLFLIEKEYWHIISTHKNYSLADLPKIIAESVGFAAVEQVSRWLDQLHDNTKVITITPPNTEVKQSIIDAYLDYLNQPSPPGKALHTTLAKANGVTSKEVHRVLCDYRREHLPQTN